MSVGFPVSRSTSTSATPATNEYVVPSCEYTSLATPIRPRPASAAAAAFVLGLISSGSSCPSKWHLDFLPWERQDVGRNACEIEKGMRAQIADTALDVQLAVWPNRQQAIMADRSRRMRADGDADAPHFVAVLLPGARGAFLPIEALGSAIERLL